VSTLPNKTNTTAKLNATCSFYWLYCSIDSRRKKAIAQQRLLKINSAYYCKVVLGKGQLPDIEIKCGHIFQKWTLQQDGAPAHTARNTTEYLEKGKIVFIEPEMWPSDSPELNLVCLWCTSAASLSRTKIQQYGRTEAINNHWMENLSQPRAAPRFWRWGGTISRSRTNFLTPTFCLPGETWNRTLHMFHYCN